MSTVLVYSYVVKMLQLYIVIITWIKIYVASIHYFIISLKAKLAYYGFTCGYHEIIMRS